MKSIIKHTLFITVAASLLALGGCKKYLDQQPITEVGTDVVFKDVNTATAAVAGVYNQLTGDNGYGLKLSLYFGVGSDLMQGPTGGADGGRRDFPLFSTTPSNTQMYGSYVQLFRGIQYANTCITNIPKMDMYSSGTDQQKKQLQRLHGEALTLRAQFYFEAIRNWGDLPAHFQAAEVLATQDPFPKRTDRDVLYDQLLADLKTAADLVPWRNEVASIGDAQDERITKGTVKGLRARIALFRGGYSLRQNGSITRPANYLDFYQIAKQETSEIMSSGQHSLNPSFKNLWKNQVGGRVAMDPNGELMFQVTGFGRSAGADTKLGYYNGPPVVDNGVSNGNSGVLVLPTYLYYFDSTDTRRDVTVAAYADTLAPDGTTFYKRGQPITNIYDGKYRRDWLTPPLSSGSYANNYSNLKWQILRYSDVLLMYAEAENEINGPTASAYDAINMVRRRGYGVSITAANPQIDLSGLGKIDFFKALVRERALELGGEGIRKFDLIRWNLLATALQETRTNLVQMGSQQVMTPPTYMAPPPSYVLNTANLPSRLFFRGRTSGEDLNIGNMVINSLYKPLTSTTAPAGTYSVNWVTSAISTGTGNSVTLNHFANGFVTGKSELLPLPQDAITAYGGFQANMPQNPNY
jgi:starch-binding outer membrane protein, SusD/RagB family